MNNKKKKEYTKLIEEILCNNPFGDLSKTNVDLIYKIIHLVNGDCKNPHKDWEKEIDEIINQLNK